MSPPNIVAMLRRHLIAVAVACLAVLGFGYHLAHMNPGYTDVGTIGFIAPNDPLTGFADSRGTQAIKVATAEYMMGSAASQQVRAAGGTANYDVELVNSYNEEYPDYSQPYVTVTTNSPDPTAALNTYNAVVSVLIKDLAQRQAQQGARPKVQITALPVNTTGPTIQSGSNKRVCRDRGAHGDRGLHDGIRPGSTEAASCLAAGKSRRRARARDFAAD